MRSVSARHAAVVVLVALAAVTSGCGRLDRDAVQTEVQTAASTAAEGMLVAREAARGRTWESFTEIRTAELVSDAKRAQETLTTPTEKGLSKPADTTLELLTDVIVALDTLHNEPNDHGVARKAQRQLSSLYDRLDEIDQSL